MHRQCWRMIKLLVVGMTVFTLVNTYLHLRSVGANQNRANQNSAALKPVSKQKKIEIQEHVNVCSSWSENHVIPIWKLDPTRFLYPGVYWGPNNQVRQLITSTYLAIKLNRTLVIPNFHTHFSTGEKTVKPHHRIDVDHLCRFVSCISLKQFQTVCNGAFGVLFLSFKLQGEFLRNILTDSGMKIPRDAQKQFTVPTFYTSKDTSAEETFNSIQACALLFGADETENVRPTFAPEPSTIWQSKMQGFGWEVVHAVNRLPRPIVEAAEEFVKEVFAGEAYVGVHWRYGSNEWKKYCNMKIKSKTKINECLNFGMISAAHVATAIYNDLKNFFPRFQQRINVYIATPPSQKYFASDIYSKLKSLDSNFYSSPIPLNEFVLNRWKTCLKDNNWDIDEAISMIEMAVMIRSKYFYYSTWSSWSNNCRYARSNGWNESKPLEVQYDARIYDLSETVMKNQYQKM